MWVNFDENKIGVRFYWWSTQSNAQITARCCVESPESFDGNDCEERLCPSLMKEHGFCVHLFCLPLFLMLETERCLNRNWKSTNLTYKLNECQPEMPPLFKNSYSNNFDKKIPNLRVGFSVLININPPSCPQITKMAKDGSFGLRSKCRNRCLNRDEKPTVEDFEITEQLLWNKLKNAER